MVIFSLVGHIVGALVFFFKQKTAYEMRISDWSSDVRSSDLRDRGTLAPGYFADVVLFDPATVQDHATFETPDRYATGVRDLFVNGVQVLKDGERSEEHTSELQSLMRISYAVFCLKKKTHTESKYTNVLNKELMIYITT